MANLRDGYIGRSPYILQRLKRAVSLAAAEDRGVVGREPEQVLVSVVALDENALNLSLTLHGNRRDVQLTFDGGHRILFPAQHEGRTLHARECREQVERVTLSARLREPARDFGTPDRARTTAGSRGVRV